MVRNKVESTTKKSKMERLNEAFIQQIWQYQFFNKNKPLETTSRKRIEVLFPGNLNTNSGPDFINSHITLEDREIYGDIEIHKKSSEWYSHKHNLDRAYDNVILHVVLENDRRVSYNDGKEIPTLLLKDYISTQNIKNLELLLMGGVNTCKFRSGEETFDFEKIVKRRMERKTRFIFSLLDSNKGNWEETFLQLLFFNFGFKVNNKEMLELARSMSYKIVIKNKEKKENILALLLGQAGLIERFYKTSTNSDEKLERTKKTYSLLKTKYKLGTQNINWHFSRLRPQNFPTQRILQLTDILYKDLLTIEKVLNNSLDEITITLLKKVTPPISSSIIENITINTVFQMQEAYKQIHYKKEINTDILKKIKGEQNNIVNKMEPLKPNNALESQALIEVYNNFCKKKRCLECLSLNCANKK